MDITKIKAYIISDDPVFTRLIEVVMRKRITIPIIERISSFIELKEKIILDHPDIVILDDIIAGAASLEIITFLRFNRRFECPIYLFCESVPDLAEKAITRGANQYYIKPFNPWSVVDEILKK